MIFRFYVYIKRSKKLLTIIYINTFSFGEKIDEPFLDKYALNLSNDFMTILRKHLAKLYTFYRRNGSLFFYRSKTAKVLIFFFIFSIDCE